MNIFEAMVKLKKKTRDGFALDCTTNDIIDSCIKAVGDNLPTREDIDKWAVKFSVDPFSFFSAVKLAEDFGLIRHQNKFKCIWSNGIMKTIEKMTADQFNAIVLPCEGKYEPIPGTEEAVE